MEMNSESDLNTDMDMINEKNILANEINLESKLNADMEDMINENAILANETNAESNLNMYIENVNKNNTVSIEMNMFSDKTAIRIIKYF